MSEKPNKYDLEDRTEQYARQVRAFVKSLKKSIANIEDGKQLIRSSGSVGANYIEANESMSTERDTLIQESTELMHIFGAILSKSDNK